MVYISHIGHESCKQRCWNIQYINFIFTGLLNESWILKDDECEAPINQNISTPLLLVGNLVWILWKSPAIVQNQFGNHGD